MKIDRKLVFNKFDGKCAYCGDSIELKAMQVDHYLSQINFKNHIMNKWRVPEWLSHLTISDVNHIDNLMPSCRSCNCYKSGNSLECFRSMVEDQINQFRKNKPTFRLAERFGLIECKPKKVVFHFEISHNIVTKPY